MLISISEIVGFVDSITVKKVDESVFSIEEKHPFIMERGKNVIINQMEHDMFDTVKDNIITVVKIKLTKSAAIAIIPNSAITNG